MRFEKVASLLDLALEMQARHMGLSLKEIAEKLGVSHRTAQRMVRGLEDTFPDIERIEDDGREHRWRLPRKGMLPGAEVTADELADLATAAEDARKAGRGAEAASLERLLVKLKAMMRPETRRKTEPDLEALLAAEGLVAVPGPRRRVPVEIVETLRHAIKAGVKVVLEYRPRGETALETRVVDPYGFLYGHRHYLICRNPARDGDNMRKYRLPDILSVTLTDDPFERDPDFSLDAYAAQSFGVFLEESADVEWRFTPTAAPVAAEYEFHPSQELTFEPDGSLTVRFRTGGLQEMAWHLMIWGDQVEVVAPARLREMIGNVRPQWDVLP